VCVPGWSGDRLGGSHDVLLRVVWRRGLARSFGLRGLRIRVVTWRSVAIATTASALRGARSGLGAGRAVNGQRAAEIGASRSAA
jgi:hypothetical protein